MQSEDHLTEFMNSYEYSENSEEILDEGTFSDNSPFITQPEAMLVQTSVLSMRNSLLNLRDSLFNYRSRAATKIQRFFRLTKQKTRLCQFFFLLSRTEKRFKKISKEFVMNCLKTGLKALQTENPCKKYRKINHKASPKRQMLVRAVSIGRALRKIDNFVEKVASRRTSPESPVKVNQNYRREAKTVRKAETFFIKLIPSSTSDESESQDSKSTTPGLDQVGWKTFRTSVDSTMESFNEPLPGTLVFKRNFRVRTQKRIRLNVDDLENALCVDLKAPKWKFEGFQGSRIPFARPQDLLEFQRVRERLTCEYKDLIK